MPNGPLAGIAQPQQQRLAHIEFRLLFLGYVNRCDLISRFGLSESAASRDIALYRKLAAGNIVYNQIAAAYQPGATFEPLYHHAPAQALTALAEGAGDDLVATPASWLPTEKPGRLSAPKVGVLAPVSRALFNGQLLQIAYRSLSSGLTKRTTTPLTLVDNGLRWHLRAYDDDRGRYADFVLNRIESAELMDDVTNAAELRAQDHDWQRHVELELVPHPSLAHPETIAFEYGMTDGLMTLQVRAALAGYLLRHWNVDCTADHHLQGPEYHLWLRNSADLRGIADTPVPNLTLAPGFVQPGAAQPN